MTGKQLRLGAGGVALAAAIVTLGGSAALSQSSPGGANPPGAPSAQDKPVEETKKNIQVLKGMPTSQLAPVMNFMAASLGVNCSFCHVINGDKWEMEKDDKDEKKVARRMIQMVLDVNKGSFSGRSAVTCYTCHRGNEDPQGIVPLPLPPAAKKEQGEGEPEAATLPAVQEILDKYARAVGGADAAAKMKTLTMKGTRQAGSGPPGSLEIYLEGTSKALIVAGGPNGETVQGLNGDTGWVKGPRGQHQFDPGEVAQIRDLLLMYQPVKVPAKAGGMKVTGTDKVGDRDAYVLRGDSGDGGSTRYFFDTRTGLLLRATVLRPTMLARIPEQTDYDDYRDVDGLKLPYSVVSSAVDSRSSASRKFTEIRQNVAIDAKKFDPPAASK